MPFYFRKTQEASPAHKYVADSDLRYSVVDKLLPAQSRDLQTCHQLEAAAAGPAGPLSGPASLPRTPLPVTSRPLVIQERQHEVPAGDHSDPSGLRSCPALHHRRPPAVGAGTTR